MNENPTLSKDRNCGVSKSSESREPFVNMFDDVIVINKTKRAFLIGRIFRMRKRGKNNRRFEIKGFVTEEERSQIIFNVQLFDETTMNNFLITNKCIEHCDSLKTFIHGQFNMSFDPETESYALMDDVRM